MNPKKIDIFTLPEPYPDEFLNSIIARYHCHSGNILEAKSRCELCGVFHRCAACFGFIRTKPFLAATEADVNSDTCSVNLAWTVIA